MGARLRGFSGEVNRKNQGLKSLDQREKITRKVRQRYSLLGFGIHALRADPENARAYLGVAKCYASRGKVQLAIENYTKAIKYEHDPQKKNDIMNKLYKEGGTWDT